MPDRVVVAAARIVLEPIFEAGFHPFSYEFRPRLSALDAVETVRRTVNRGGPWAFDADIQSCFDEGRGQGRPVDVVVVRADRSGVG